MKNADIALLLLIRENSFPVHGLDNVAIFPKYSSWTRHNAVKPVSETALKRLAHEGLIEVETHNVSDWSFGPKYPAYNFRHLHGDAAYTAEIERIKEVEKTLPARKLSSRSEIWVHLTTLGHKALADIGLG